jgi:uncharacterized protein YigE (DUF2233 family)
LKSKSIFIASVIIVLTGTVIFLKRTPLEINDNRFISYIVDTKKQQLKFLLKNDSNENFRSLENVRTWLTKNNKKLVFASNGGMYKQGNVPQGLYIEDNKNIAPLDTTNGTGNFYLKPNGVFYVKKDKSAVICNTANFIDDGNIAFATQSGPMLVIDGKIHEAFTKESTNLNIRNAVGILADNRIIFAMSKKEINFYEFANFFKKLGCKNAL